MRPSWARYLAASVIAIGMAALTTVPVAAREVLNGPIVMDIEGANGQSRGFLATTVEDRRAALALVAELSGRLRAPAEPIEEAATTLPHYRIGIGQFAYLAIVPSVPHTTLIYYPGGDGQSFLMLDSRGQHASTDEWWIEPSPDVLSLLQRHLDGLPPIGAPAATAGPSTSPWGAVLGAALLAALSALLWEDRRRWRRRGRGSADPKGT